MPYAKYVAEGVANFADRRVGLHRFDDRGHHVVIALADLLDLLKGLINLCMISARLQLLQPLNLPVGGMRIWPEDRYLVGLLLLPEHVHSYDGYLAGSNLALMFQHGLLIFLVNEA